MRLKKVSGRRPVKDDAFYARRRSELDALNSEFEQRRKRLRDFRDMRPGAARREVLMAWLREGRATGDVRQVYVNRKWQLQLHQDSDLQYLLKKGLLVRERRNQGYSPSLGARAGSFQTVLVLAP